MRRVFGWLGPDRGDVAPWSAVTKMPLKPAVTRPEPGFTRPKPAVTPKPGFTRPEVVVRPV